MQQIKALALNLMLVQFTRPCRPQALYTLNAVLVHWICFISLTKSELIFINLLLLFSFQVISDHGGIVDECYSDRITHVLCDTQKSEVFKLVSIVFFFYILVFVDCLFKNYLQHLLHTFATSDLFIWKVI